MGFTQTFAQPLALTGEHFEPTYQHGMDAGSIRIAAPSLALDGTLLGQTAPGLRQVRDKPTSSDMPKGGALTINLQAQQPTPFPARYTMGGGNGTIRAGGDIERLTSINGGPLIADSGRELPNNWLNRRG